MSRAPSVVLTIAGSDSGGGAGIQADLKTFAAFGVWGTSAVTAVTAQNTLGVRDTRVLDAGIVRAQIDAVVEDLGVQAAKTGMLGSAQVVEAVAAAVSAHRLAPLVVDPVFVTTAGDLLLVPAGVAVMRELLLPLATVVTPNLAEAEALLGTAVDSPRAMVDAAHRLGELGPAAVLLKGGHLGTDRSPDLLWQDGQVRWLDGPRLDSRSTHGTGCTLSAALCAQIAGGADLLTAATRAKRFVTDAIRAGLPLGRGVGPVNPGWSLRG